MLPALFWPDLGGGVIESPGSVNQAVGIWMRRNLVSALIYPSARSDVAVLFRDGELDESYGWNLVDYRGSTDVIPAAQEMVALGTFNSIIIDHSPWTKDFPYSAMIRRTAGASKLAGSWQLVGPEREGLRRTSFGYLIYPSWTQSFPTVGEPDSKP
jgi:hypothetical protein